MVFKKKKTEEVTAEVPVTTEVAPLEFLTLEDLRKEMAKGTRQFVIVNQSWMDLHNGDQRVAFEDAIRAEGKSPSAFWTNDCWCSGRCHEGPHYFVYTE